MPLGFFIDQQSHTTDVGFFHCCMATDVFSVNPCSYVVLKIINTSKEIRHLYIITSCVYLHTYNHAQGD